MKKHLLDNLACLELTDRNGLQFESLQSFKDLIYSCQSDEQWEIINGRLCNNDSAGSGAYAAVCFFVAEFEYVPLTPLHLLAFTVRLEKFRQMDCEPALPLWLQTDYMSSLDELGLRTIRQMGLISKRTWLRHALALTALWKKLPVYGTALSEYSEAELSKFFMNL